MRTKTLGNLADAVAIEWPIAVSIAVPIDQEIVASPARQDVDVNMQDRLPGEFAIKLTPPGRSTALTARATFATDDATLPKATGGISNTVSKCALGITRQCPSFAG